LPLFLAEVSQSVLLVDQQCSVNIFVVRIIEPDLIQDNIHWNREIQTVVRAISQYDHATDKLDAYKKTLEEDYKNVEKKIKLAGLNPILGRVLREQRNSFAMLSLSVCNNASSWLAAFSS
jgi:hypothetical protein